jgi:signal transduction histidine kinase
MTETRQLRVFLCHSSQDKPIVRELYQRLNSEGWIDPWLDEEKLLPGQDWDLEITKALLDTDAVVVSLSKTSTTKEGYVRKEINNALEKLKEKPEDSNYLIPVRLEECVMPMMLQQWHYVDFFPNDRRDSAYQRLLSGLRLRANILGIHKAENIEIESLKQRDLLGRAMAAIEHRINNTFNIIIPNIERLRKRVNTNDPEIKEILDLIERNTRYASSLIDKIRALSLDFEYVDIDINVLLSDMVTQQKQNWSRDSSHASIDMSLDLDKRIPIIRLPVGQVVEVLENLIQNALRALNLACHSEGLRDAKLKVSSSLEERSIVISVNDNASGGISPKIAERLFRSPVPSQTPGEGSGVGLWLSNLIMNSIGGAIGIDNTGLSGTSMSVKFPIPD